MLMKAENREKKKGRGRMRKIKALGMMFILSVSSAMLLAGCEKKLQIDVDECAEIALEYMNNKYGAEFELYSGVVKRDGGGPKYAEIMLDNKADNTDNLYDVIVYPDGLNDEDKNDYYDSYKVVSDDYMEYLLCDYAKNELDKLLAHTSLTRFISSTGIEERGGVVGFSGFSSDFPVPSEESFNLRTILDNHKTVIYCWLDIPESEYSDTLQEEISSVIRKVITLDDLVTFSIDVYDDEIYKEIENTGEYNSKENRRIDFSIEKEEENEFE